MKLLADQLGVDGSLKFTDHFRIGEEVARHLQHLEKLASVVPADKRGRPRRGRLSHVSLQRAGTSFATLRVRNSALSHKENPMAIHTIARPLTIATLALAAVLAAGCQSTTRTSSVDRGTTMGGPGPAHATTGPGTVSRSGTNGGSDAGTTGAGATPAAPGTSGSGTPGAGPAGTGGAAGSGGTH